MLLSATMLYCGYLLPFLNCPTLTGWFLLSRWTEFTARYKLDRYRFAKLRKAIISFVMEQLSHGTARLPLDAFS